MRRPLCVGLLYPTPPPQSGIDVSDDILALFDGTKKKKENKYFSFSLVKTGKSGNQDVYGWEILDKSGPMPDEENQASFSAMVKSLPEDAARFVVFDFTETKADGRQIKKLVLIKW